MNAIDKKNKLFSFNDDILDVVYAKVVAQFGMLEPIIPKIRDEYFGSLCESIISQQLSTKVAEVISKRVKQTVGGQWIPEKVLAASIGDLRTSGLSNSKASYIHNCAEAWVDKKVEVELFDQLDDEEIIQQLIHIKGIGRWTAEMFLIFTMGRSDIFSIGDYGLRKAVTNIYTLEMDCKKSVIEEISRQWSPHRSLASRVLWKSLELPKAV